MTRIVSNRQELHRNNPTAVGADNFRVGRQHVATHQHFIADREHRAVRIDHAHSSAWFTISSFFIDSPESRLDRTGYFHPLSSVALDSISAINCRPSRITKSASPIRPARSSAVNVGSDAALVSFAAALTKYWSTCANISALTIPGRAPALLSPRTNTRAASAASMPSVSLASR